MPKAKQGPAAPFTHEERAARRDRIARLLQRGMSPEQIVRKLSVDMSLVQHTARLFGLPFRNQRPAVATLRVLGAIFRNPTARQVDLAEQLGCTPEFVRQVRQQARYAGVPVPPYKKNFSKLA